MKDIEATRRIRNKLSHCPRCDGYLEHQKTAKIECVDCGLRIEIGSKLGDYMIWALIACMFVAVIAFILG